MCHFRALPQDTHPRQRAGTFVCRLLGPSHCSPCSLFRSFASGCVALPVLMNIKAVIEQRQCTGVWSHKDELPVRPGMAGGGQKALGRAAPAGSRTHPSAGLPRSRSNWA